jgi:UDP-GlcNAc:undecaprenyl-phosphate/decaprenyl-phosphate GlcNAc-1-phosphate transferase
MYSLLFLGFTSFFLSLLFVPIVRNLALHFGIVDNPSEDRKIHAIPIPRLGGVAILAAAVCSSTLLLLVRLNGGAYFREGYPTFAKLIPAVTVIFCVGLADDILDLSPWIKLIPQIFASGLAWTCGFRLEAIGGHSFSPAISLLLTVLWLLACSNAVNLIDGVDGLAAGASLFATITMLIAGLLHGNMYLVFVTIPLAGALLGFLRYNFSPASIFMGDCGSLSIGLLLGCYGLLWSEKSTTLLGMTAPLLALFVPLLDASISILRRFLRKQPIFQGDRHHIHHKLLSRGLTPRHVVLVLYAFCGLAAAASLLMSELHPRYQGAIIFAACVVVGVGLRYLGYNELGIAGKLMVLGGFRQQVHATLVLETFEHELDAAETMQECWELICRAYPEFGFCGVELHVEESRLHGENSTNWHVHIDFPGHGHISLLRKAAVRNRGTAAFLFIDCIAYTFNRKLEEFSQDQSRVPHFATVEPQPNHPIVA